MEVVARQQAPRRKSTSFMSFHLSPHLLNKGSVLWASTSCWWMENHLYLCIMLIYCNKN